MGAGINLYFKGHLLILLIYLVLLIFFSQITGGMKTGYLKPGSVFGSEIMALAFTNILTYFQLSLMKNWLLQPGPFFMTFCVQLVLAAVWAYLSSAIYRKVFPPRETLVINFSDINIVEKFETRADRFEVQKEMLHPDMEEAKHECVRWYGCVVICGGTEEQRRTLMEFCYRHFIRVYLVPKMSDLLIQGCDHMDLFDTPILELKEYTIRWEIRLVKRLVDLLVGILAFPFTLFGRKEQTVCMGKDGREFIRYGRGFRNLVNGTMSLIGPEARELSAAKEQIERDERAVYRYRIKPGITGYSQQYRNMNTSEEDRLKMDLYYIQHYSFLNDFKLLLQALRPGRG